MPKLPLATVKTTSPAAVATISALPPSVASPMTGIVLKLFSVSVFIVMSALVKEAAALGAPAGQTVFFRSFFCLPVVVVWLMMRGELTSGLRTSRPGSHLRRGMFGLGGMVANFAGLAMLPLPEVTAIFYSIPLFVTIFAAIFLGERIRLFRVSTIAVGMLGVLVVMWPRLTESIATHDPRHALGVLVVLAGAICSAVAAMTMRQMADKEHVGAVVFYFTLLTTVLSLVSLPFGWAPPGGGLYWMLIATGVVGGIGQILLTASYRYADAAVISSFEFLSVVLSIIIGYFFFDEVPTTPMLAGAALVVAAGIALAWRERKVRQRAA